MADENFGFAIARPTNSAHAWLCVVFHRRPAAVTGGPATGGRTLEKSPPGRTPSVEYGRRKECHPNMIPNPNEPANGRGNDLVAAVATGAALTMSSREIAELTGKEHRNVMRDGRAMLSELYGEGGMLSFEHTYRNQQNGQEYPELRLPKRETLILVSGYSVEMRARIIDRWQELEQREARGPAVDYSSPTVILGVITHLKDENETLKAENAILAPKAIAHDVIADSFGAVCRRIAAKNLQIPPQVLNRWMAENGWTYVHAATGDTLAYQSKITAGYLIHKVTTGPKGDGTNWTSTNVHVTPKGMLALAKAFPPSLRQV